MKLFIIHGWTYTIEHWQKTIQMLEKQGVKVVMLKVPGLTSPSQKVFEITDYVSWADLNLPEDAIVLGHSNGGRILLNMCAEKKRRKRKLILLNAAGIYEKSFKKHVARIVGRMFGRVKKITCVRKLGQKILRAGDYAKAPENMKKTLTKMLESDQRLDFAKIKAPAIILWGEADKITPLRQGKKMAEKMGVELITVKDWGHAPYITDPKGLTKKIISAIKKLEQG